MGERDALLKWETQKGPEALMAYRNEAGWAAGTLAHLLRCSNRLIGEQVMLG